MSPFHRDNDIKTPILLVWEKAVYSREKFEQERFAEKMQDNGVEVESYMVENLISITEAEYFPKLVLSLRNI